MHKNLIRAMLIICWLLFPSCLPARAQAVLEKNLVVNGDFEAGPASADGAVVASIPGWDRTGNATVMRYGPGFADPGAFLHGSNFLAGGSQQKAYTISSATQAIDVSNTTFLFNRGGVTFTVSAFLGNFLGQSGNIAMYVTFNNSANANLKYLAFNSNVEPRQFFRSQSGVVPAGTTWIQVAVFMMGGSGVYNDAYADNVSVVLHAPKLDTFASGQPQIALSNPQTQQVDLLTLNGEHFASQAFVDTPLPEGWRAVGAGDFSYFLDFFPSYHGSNLVLQNPSTGEVGFWYMSGSKVAMGEYAGVYSGYSTPTMHATLPPGWRVSGVGDINGDGLNDLVLYNPIARQVAFWFMRGTAVLDGAYASRRDGSIATLPEGWEVSGAADIDGDGHVDIVLQNLATGQVAAWFMNNNLVVAGALLTETLPPGWSIAGNGDYNGDGITDLILQNPSTNQAAFWYLGGVTIGSDQLPDSVLITGGARTDLYIPADWTVVAPR